MIKTADEIKSGNNSNPFSTSGGGINFEQLVGTTYLVSLLTQEIPRGIDSGICKEVRFQQRWAGCLLDDIVVIANDGTIERKLAIQVKHDLFFSDAPTNDTFAEAINASWKTFIGTFWKFNQDTDRLCIALGISQPKIDKHFRPILEWARTSRDSDEFIKKVTTQGFSSKEKKGYLQIMRNLLSKAKGSDLTNDELWQFLKCLVVIDFDLENAGSRDTTNSWNRLLTTIKGQDSNQAIVLFNVLTAIVKEFASSAGSITLQALRARIDPKIPLNDIPDCTLDLANLRKHTDLILASINDAIGLKIKLPRIEKVDELEALVKDNEVVVISDEPMTGKSVLLKLLANRLRAEGEIIAFSVERFAGPTLGAFLQSLQIQNDLSAILSSIGGAPFRCILIDGIERAKDEEKKRILNDLILTIQSYNKLVLSVNRHKNNCWRIVCTCRSSECQNILIHTNFRENLANSTLKAIELGVISNEEIGEVQKQFPNLTDILSKENLKHFISRPLILDILTLPNITISSKHLPSKLTETWLLDWYWKEIVRLGEGNRYGLGQPDQREKIILNLAKKSLKGEIVQLDKINIDTEAVSGLISDRLLVKEGNTLRFAHDVIEDWAQSTLLKNSEQQLVQFLLDYKEPLSLVRPFSLYASSLLEQDQYPDKWLNLLKLLKDKRILSPHWLQLTLTAPLFSPMLEEILPKIKEHLFQDTELLSEFLKALRTSCVKPDSSIYSVFHGISQESFEQYLAYWTIPAANQWIPIIELMLQKQETIKDNVTDEFSFICEKWMTWSVNDTNQLLRQKIARFSLTILENGLLQVYEDQPKNRYILSVLYSANCLYEDASKFILTKALRDSDHKNYGFEELILEQGWIPICRFLPQIAVNLLKAILCDKRGNDRYEYHDFFELGMRYTRWNPPTYLEGPFLIFLRMHEEQGLELIHEVVNHATEVWKKREEHGNRQPLPQTLQLEGKNIELWGDEHVFQWYRYPNVAPNAITCALMALEHWMNEQVKNKEKIPKQLFKNVLMRTNSMAMVGVCSSVGLSNINASLEGILPILENPAIWIADIYRLGQDATAESSIKAFANYFSLNRTKEQNSYRILLELARQPHRRFDFRSFILPILLGPNEILRDRLQNAMCDFPNKIPIFFQDEKENTKLLNQRLDICKILAAQSDIKNYQTFEIEGKVGLQFKMPAELENEQREKTEAVEKFNRVYGLLGWSLTLLDDNRPVPTAVLDSAFKFADELVSNDNPNYQPNDPIEYSEMQAQAIAAFAAAIVINNWQWIEDNKKCSWFEKQLLIAATRPEPQSEKNNPISIYPMGYRRSAARALCRLQQKVNKKIVRENIFALSTDANTEVRRFLFTGLRDLWLSDPELVWDCIDANIKQANIFHSKNRKIGDYLPTEIDTDTLILVLYCIPTSDEINQIPQIDKIIDILEEMLRFTVTSYSFYQDKNDQYNSWDHKDWNQTLFWTIANVGLRIPQDKAKTIFFEHVLENWVTSPPILITFLRSLLAVGGQRELEDKLAKLWLDIGKAIIAKLDSCNLRDFSEIAGLLIFTDPHGIISWTVSEWKPLRSLVPLIEEWCQKIGYHADAFPSLVRFLKTIGFSIFSEYGISWLFTCLSRMNDEKAALQKVSFSLSELLCNAWSKQKAAIKQNPENLRRFILMVDKLASYGNPEAIRLQSKLQSG